MNVLRSAQRTLSISLEGLREAIFAIAERVALRVQRSKLQLQAEDAESRLRQTYEALGECLYKARTAPHEPFAPDAALPLSTRIREQQFTLQEIRDRLAAQYDDLLAAPLMQLENDLKTGGGTIERVTVSPGAPADGKRLGDLALPPTVRLVALRRNESLLIPADDVVLNAGDQITLLGPRSSVSGALQILRV
jgi:hypothetical protein